MAIRVAFTMAGEGQSRDEMTEDVEAIRRRSLSEVTAIYAVLRRITGLAEKTLDSQQ